MARDWDDSAPNGPWQNLPSTATPVEADYLTAVDEQMEDLAAASTGRVPVLEQKVAGLPFRADNVSTAGAQVGGVCTVTAVDGSNLPTAHRYLAPFQVLTATGDGTTDDTTALNAQLAAAPAGMVLRGQPGKTYLISAPLVMRAGGYQTLDLSGCTVTLAAGSNCNMLRNAAVTAVRSVTDAAMTSASTTLTSATAAFTSADVGRSVILTGAGASSGVKPLVAKITAVASGTSVTLDTAAQATVSAAALSLYNRETGLRVRGGRWNRGANGGTGNDQHSLFFRHVDDIVIDVEAIVATSGKYACAVGDFTAAHVTLRGLSTFSDGLHISGPAKGLTVPLIEGTCGDDMLGLICGDYPAYQDVAGDITEVSVGTIRAVGSGRAALHCVSGIGNTIDRVDVQAVVGSTVTETVVVGDDASQAATTGGTYGTIDVHRLEATVTGSTAGGLGAAVWLVSPAIERFAVHSGRHHMTQSGANQPYVRLTGGNATVIGALIFEDYTFSGTSAVPNTCKGFDIATSATIRQLVIDTCRWTPWAGGNLVALSAGTVEEIVVGDVFSNSNGKHILLVGGTLGRVKYLGGRLTQPNTLIESTVSGAALHLTLVGTTIVNGARIASHNGTLTCLLEGADVTTTQEIFFCQTASTSTIIEGHATLAGGAIAARAGSAPYPNVRSLGIRGSASILSKANGDMVWNTNAAHGAGAGPLVCDGTNWKNLFTGTSAAS